MEDVRCERGNFCLIGANAHAIKSDAHAISFNAHVISFIAHVISFVAVAVRWIALSVCVPPPLQKCNVTCYILWVCVFYSIDF